VDKVADFAVTQIAFNPIGTYLAASSVANSVSLIALDESLGQTRSMKQMVMEYWIWVLAALIILFALSTTIR
jgi:ABC-type arginine transport system permease subunit